MRKIYEVSGGGTSKGLWLDLDWRLTRELGLTRPHRDSRPSRNREETTLYDTKGIEIEERIFKREKKFAEVKGIIFQMDLL